MREVQRLSRVQHIDLHIAQPIHRAHEVAAIAVAGVVALHVGDHQVFSRPLRRGDHRIGLAQCVAHRLLDDHMLAGFERGDRLGCVRAGGQHDHHVQVLLLQR